jgi:hypothetical protein
LKRTLLLCAWLAACVADKSPTGDPGDGAIDGATDATTGDGAAVDGTPGDASPRDGAPVDATPVDAALPDTDGDGVPDARDNCPAAANPTQADADADGLGDACDVGDADGDGLADRDDPCPLNPAMTPDTDGDGFGDACDVCPRIADPGQPDADNDGIGDACEIPNDDDADGVPDATDNCPRITNGDQADTDSDGVGNVCDICPQNVDPQQRDTDGDGLGDGCDICPEAALVAENHTDRDGDGQPTCAGDCDDTNPQRAVGLPEACDGVDNDCDRSIDEDFPDVGEPCEDGLGACHVEGTFVCTIDRLGSECSARPPLGGVELCNDIDDDCDGSADEDVPGCCEPGEVLPCGTDEGACTRGERTCDAEGTFGACDGVGPANEVCNGLDDDCDGQVDDIPGQLECGRGRCRHAVPLCEDGAVPVCDPFEGAEDEVCNGIDDDCDGMVDLAECFEIDVIPYRLYMDAIHMTLGMY